MKSAYICLLISVNHIVAHYWMITRGREEGEGERKRERAMDVVDERVLEPKQVGTQESRKWRTICHVNIVHFSEPTRVVAVGHGS